MSTKKIEGIILVIDDDESVRDVLVMMLEHSGYNVLGASSLKDALDKYKNKLSSVINIILLDYAIPNENFFKTLKFARAEISPLTNASVIKSSSSITRFCKNEIFPKIEESFRLCIRSVFKLMKLEKFDKSPETEVLYIWMFSKLTSPFRFEISPVTEVFWRYKCCKELIMLN